MNLVYGCKSLFSRIFKHFQPQLQGMEVVKANGSASLAYDIGDQDFPGELASLGMSVT